MHDQVNMMVASILWFLLVLLHFLPTLIAFHRRHPNRVAILLLNLLLGWTGIGWIVALIWSATNIKK